MTAKSFVATLSALSLLTLLGVGSVVSATAATDTTAPSYVDNVEAVAGDGEVQLSWDTATDNTGVTGYKIYYGTDPVTAAGQSYNLGTIEIEEVLTYTVTGLDNEITYYFAVTALDAAGNESAEYSVEVSATPTTSSDDGNPPSVVSARATDCDAVEVTFSESVQLPETGATAVFEIENFDTLQYLTVTEAAYGSSSSVVTLTTSTMEEDAQYLLTVGTDLEDLYGNPLVSGTSDTGSFKGIACVTEEETTEEETTEEETTEEETAEDTEAPQIEDVDAESLTELVVAFNEEVVLPELEDDGTNPAVDYFDIYDESNTLLEVVDVEYYQEEGEVDEEGNPVVLLHVLRVTTSEQTPDTAYFLSVTGLMDDSGNAAEGSTEQAAEFLSPSAEEAADAIAPEDVTNLISSVADLLVNLTWESSVNSAGDLVDQILYISRDGGTTYEAVGSVGTGTTYSYEGGVEGESYTFKITTVDEAGNESTGAVVTAVLPTTGPGLIALGAASLLGGGLLGRKKKQ